MHYHAIIQITITGGGGNVASVHIHGRIAAVSRRAKVSITIARCLRIGGDGVATSAALPIIVLLEVAVHFVKAVVVPDIVGNIVPVEQIVNGGVYVAAHSWIYSQIPCMITI